MNVREIHGQGSTGFSIQYLVLVEHQEYRNIATQQVCAQKKAHVWVLNHIHMSLNGSVTMAECDLNVGGTQRSFENDNKDRSQQAIDKWTVLNNPGICTPHMRPVIDLKHQSIATDVDMDHNKR